VKKSVSGDIKAVTNFVANHAQPSIKQQITNENSFQGYWAELNDLLLENI
jgi:hypothetical protein